MSPVVIASECGRVEVREMVQNAKARASDINGEYGSPARAAASLGRSIEDVAQ